MFSWWPYLQFWFLNFCKQQAIIIIVYCFTHLFFPFSPVCVHPGKESLSKGFKGISKTITWHRNCPGGCQYQFLNCWYTSIREWICVITEWLNLPNHDSSFCFIAEEPGFGGCLCLILFVLCFAIENKFCWHLYYWLLGSGSQLDWGLTWQWSPLYKFEHTPNRDNYSDSYTDWGNMTAVLLHLIIIAVLVVLI